MEIEFSFMGRIHDAVVWVPHGDWVGGKSFIEDWRLERSKVSGAVCIGNQGSEAIFGWYGCGRT